MSNNFETTAFDGVLLDDAQRDRLKIHIRSTLGESNYDLAENFFISVWKSTAKYKVFLARRCLNLMYTFYRTNYAVPDAKLSSTLYSDVSLLANISDIADSYLRWGGFPEIIIVDDILIHGRTINSLIDALINGVCDYLKKNGCEDERNMIESALLGALTIRVIVQTNKPLLLRNQYYQCMKDKRNQSVVWVPRRWRELSLRISQLILENVFYNTSYILSLHTSAGLSYNTSIEASAKKCGFEKFVYTGRFNRTVWVKPLKNDSGEIFAFYTVRISQNRVNKGFCIVPFVIMADFACDPDGSLFSDNKTVSGLLEGLDDCDSDGRIKSEALYLLLSHNLLLLLHEANGVDWTPDLFDIDKISISFKSSRSDKSSSFPKLAAELTKPFMSWREMDSFILSGTGSSEPLFRSETAGTKSNYIRVIEDIIAEEGRIMEHNAFMEYSKKIYSLQRTGKHPITKLFSELSKQLDIKKINLSGLVSKLLELMDMGSTAVSTKKSGVSGRDFIICGYRPGEQSLFILPKRYILDLPVLIVIEKDCYSNLYAINKRIDTLYKDTPDYAEEVKSFVAGLYDSGQLLIDWDISMLLWSEISDETCKMYPGKSNDYLLTAQMISNIFMQEQLMERYRELYPEK